MEISQINRGMSNFFKVDNLDGIGEHMAYEIGMLENNTFKYLVKTSFSEVDQKKDEMFKIDGLSSLKNFFGTIAPGKKDLYKLLCDIRDCIKEIMDYILFPENLVLSFKYILFDKEQDVYRFLYIPGYRKNFSQQIKGLMEDIMRIYDHGNKDDVIYLYDIYGKLLIDNFTPEMYCKLITEPDIEKTDKEFIVKTVSDTKINEITLSDKMVTEEINKDTVIINEIKKKKSNTKDFIILILIICFGGGLLYFFGIRSLFFSTAVLAVYIISLIGKFLSEKDQKQLDRDMEVYRNIPLDNNSSHYEILEKKEQNEVTRMIPVDSKSGEMPIILEEGEIKVGRDVSCCNFFLIGPGISRVHAIIKKEKDGVFIMDLGSTNGTYINNNKIESNVLVQAGYGDLISFAGSEYYCL